MKKLLFVAACALAVVNAAAQGTVNFSNLGVGLNQPIYDTDDTTKIGTGYSIGLWAGADAGSLAPVAGATVASGANGLFFGGTKAIAGQAGGTRPFLEVRVWDSAATSYDAAIAGGQKYGTSGAFQIGAPLGDPAAQPPTTPATLVGLPRITLVPEPSTIALGVLGAAALLLRRRK
jgi:hypothetical protein